MFRSVAQASWDRWPFRLQRSPQSLRSKPVTVSATIEAIDPATRVVTLKGPEGNSVDVTAPEQMEGFKKLKVGDQVTATYFGALAVRVRKPGDPAPSTEPSTTTSRKERTPGSETRRQQTFTVTVEAVDPAAPSVTVKGPKGRVVTLAVSDPKNLENVKAGDTVDVTYVRIAADQGCPPEEEGLTLGQRGLRRGSARRRSSLAADRCSQCCLASAAALPICLPDQDDGCAPAANSHRSSVATSNDPGSPGTTTTSSIRMAPRGRRCASSSRCCIRRPRSRLDTPRRDPRRAPH